MLDILVGIVAGFAAALLLGIWWRARGPRPKTTVHHSVESFRAVGELVALKVFTQQIVTRTDHLMGEIDSDPIEQ